MWMCGIAGSINRERERVTTTVFGMARIEAGHQNRQPLGCDTKLEQSSRLTRRLSKPTLQ